jgi:hypothetical protein
MTRRGSRKKLRNTVKQTPIKKWEGNHYMENNENLVTEQVAENVEQTTEQSPKTYTEAEFNAKLDEVLGKKIARKEAKIRKEYERKYGDLESVLKAGTGKESVEEVTDTFREFYEKKGIQIQKNPALSDNDIERLAKADAEDIIQSGYEDVVEEVDRLADIGVGNMTAREKAMFKVLAEHRSSTEKGKELAKLAPGWQRFGNTGANLAPWELRENARKQGAREERKARE